MACDKCLEHPREVEAEPCDACYWRKRAEVRGRMLLALCLVAYVWIFRDEIVSILSRLPAAVDG